MFLIGTSCSLFAVGGAGWMTPYIRSWNPSVRARAAGAPITIDLTTIPAGTLLVEEWRGRPIYIVKRTQEMIAFALELNSELLNPDSADDQQPEYARNNYRSIKPEILVIEGVCTHLGCTPKFRNQKNTNGFTGFFCPCHGSKFDFSGRVYKGVPAPTNLKVPPHHFTDANTLVVGIDEERQA
jgi:ubiquinol-cytochrome c reductase iron-sulfur subunit